MVNWPASPQRAVWAAAAIRGSTSLARAREVSHLMSNIRSQVKSGSRLNATRLPDMTAYTSADRKGSLADAQHPDNVHAGSLATACRSGVGPLVPSPLPTVPVGPAGQV